MIWEFLVGVTTGMLMASSIKIVKYRRNKTNDSSSFIKWQKVLDMYEKNGESLSPMYNGFRGEEIADDDFFKHIREICEREYAKLKPLDKLRADYVSIIDRQITLYGSFSPDIALDWLIKNRGINA